MTAPGAIEAYLASLAQRLGSDPNTAAIVAELRDHLLEAKRSELLRGATPDESERRAVARCGDLPLVVAAFAAERRRERFRRWLGFLGNLSFARRKPVFGLKSSKSKPFACSFCGKDNAAVKRLIAGPNGVFICDACVGLCNEILERHKQPSPA